MKVESCFSSSDSSSESEHSKVSSKHSKSKKKHKKSGIHAKSSDKVKYPQRYPHSSLQFEYVNKSVSFENLDLKLFVAGELEIISDETVSKRKRKEELNY